MCGSRRAGFTRRTGSDDRDLQLGLRDDHCSSWRQLMVWSDRHLFSKRCLMFLQNRVIFQCQLEWLDESVVNHGAPILQKLKAPRTAPRIRLYDDFEDGNSSLASLLYGFQKQSQALKSRKFFDF